MSGCSVIIFDFRQWNLEWICNIHSSEAKHDPQESIFQLATATSPEKIIRGIRNRTIQFPEASRTKFIPAPRNPSLQGCPGSCQGQGIKSTLESQFFEKPIFWNLILMRLFDFPPVADQNKEEGGTSAWGSSMWSRSTRVLWNTWAASRASPYVLWISGAA